MLGSQPLTAFSSGIHAKAPTVAGTIAAMSNVSTARSRMRLRVSLSNPVMKNG